MVSKSKEKLPACKLSTIINRQFLIVKLIGKGSYGVVYEVLKVSNPKTRLACKTELSSSHNNLKTEWEVMRLLKENKAIHCISGVELGCERNFNYIIMKLVGPSLSDLRKSTPKKELSLYSTTVCGIQCFDALVEIQKLGMIHRDVKPSNFAVGLLGLEEEKLVHVLDFGLCRNLFNKNKQLRKPRMKAPFRGTLIYCSLNIHNRSEPARHDDFWSLLYMLVEFIHGGLPWEKMTKENTKKAKEKQFEELLDKCPTEFKMIRCHLMTLSYSKQPDYEILRGVLCQIMHVNKFSTEKPLDWQIGGQYESCFPSRHKPQTGEKKWPLSELLNLPKFGDKLFSLSDFPKPGEAEPSRDESISKSDDTIIEKEGPPPAPKHVSRPVVPVRNSAEQATPAIGKGVKAKKEKGETIHFSNEQPTQKMDQPTPKGNKASAGVSTVSARKGAQKTRPLSGAQRKST